MNIGEFKSVDGQLLGFISTAELNLTRLGLRPVQSNNPNAPKFEVVTLNAGRRWVQIGAVWEAKSNKTGEFFLQGSIDDPSFSAPLSIACFGNDDDGYRVAWTRNRRRQNGFGQSDGTDAMGRAGEPAGEGMGEGDGFEGNATEDGKLADGAQGGTEPARRSRKTPVQEPEVPAFS